MVDMGSSTCAKGTTRHNEIQARYVLLTLTHDVYGRDSHWLLEKFMNQRGFVAPLYHNHAASLLR